MPRPARIEYENAFYHVTNRGRGRQSVFHNAAFYRLFLDTLAESHERFDAVFHAYCLLGNHYHLLIETPRANLGRIMRHINGVYTQRYNRLKKTDGPLFRGRYKAIIVDEDAYLLQLSRYIHRNPIEVKAIKTRLEEYKWSSYPAYIGTSPAPPWLYQEMTYQMLGNKQRYKGYRTYVEAGIDEDIARFYNKGNIAAVLGDKVFRESVYEQNEGVDSAVLQATLRHRPSLKAIVTAVAKEYKLPEANIVQSGSDRRVRNDARKLAIYCCQIIGDIPLAEIANGFGLGHVGSVSRLIYD
ncbi:MAG: transposase, partial [Thiohalomonadales bacterium]